MGLVNGILSLAREPVRITLRAWELGLSGAATVARAGLELLDPERSGPPHEPGYEPRERSGNGGPPDVETAPPAEPEVVVPETGVLAPEPGEVGPEPDVLDVEAPSRAPEDPAPDHVDTEPELVAEVAEEGAEEGAGPELHVDAPWDGYDSMTAADIRDRLAAATAEEAAAVELYEAAGKGRSSVLAAAEQALRT
jgi:hypothetical protein